jgi:DNA repair protein RadC
VRRRSANPLPSWHPEDRPTYAALVKDVCGCSKATITKVVDAYPRGCGLEYASLADLRSLGLTSKQGRQLHGAFVLSRWVRENVECRIEGPIRRPTDIVQYLGANLGHEDQESFLVILLDARQNIIDTKVAAVGSLAQVDVHPREVFRDAVRLRAHSMIVSHNHPSGEAEPSPADIELTHRLAEAGRLAGIPVLDHLIVARGRDGSLRATSLAERGLIGSR